MVMDAVRAASHVSHNKATYIAGGLGAAAGAAGMAATGESEMMANFGTVGTVVECF